MLANLALAAAVLVQRPTPRDARAPPARMTQVARTAAVETPSGPGPIWTGCPRLSAAWSRVRSK